MKPTDDQLRNARAWAAARPGLSGSGVIVAAIDELLELRAGAVSGVFVSKAELERLRAGERERFNTAAWTEQD